MARKRLTPPPGSAEAAPALETKAFGLARTIVRERPPIARVAGESAAEAALAELSSEIEAARAEGRLVQALPTGAIDAGHLVRDRLAAEDDEMAALKASIAERGQQVPIEVVDLGAAADPRYGLISGWRRLTALRALHAETGEARFATVAALLRRPSGAAEAYRAMVEENELRVNLSHWERARIAARAAELGLYPTPAHALRGLFAAASRAKRSKIGSFLALVAALDGSVRFPAAIPERLGLDLARALQDDPGLAPRLRDALAAAAPADAASEQAVLARAAAKRRSAAGSGRTPAPPPAEGLRISRRGARIVLEGRGVDAALESALREWLAARA